MSRHPRHLPICRQCLILRPQHRHITTSSSSNPNPSSSSSSNSNPTSRTTLSQRTAEYIDTLQLRALAAGQRLNDFTGYSSIESLKTQIQNQEETARQAREAVTTAKREYSEAVTTRAETQRELTNLLNRKTSWNPDDLARFTRLYPTDHENEARVQRTADTLSLRERESEEASAELGKLILSRYHEEQIWSDKIRRASTWGTFALMGVNVVLFVVVQIGLEPWRRKRLVRGFEEKVREVVGQSQIEQNDTINDAIQRSHQHTQPSRKVTEMGETALGHAELGGTAFTASETGNTVSGLEGENIGAEILEEAEEIESIMDNEREKDLTEILQKKEIWISAAGGAVIGGIITAVGTFILSR